MYKYDIENVFAKILRKEISCQKVYEDDYCLSFHDIAPLAPVHVLCIPKLQVVNFDAFINVATPQFFHYFFNGLSNTIKILELQSGYRLISNSGANAMQTVEHFHIHILGGEFLGGLLPETYKEHTN
ncbi:HIT domain-containing protein [Candidatus Fokinia crypta]|uniref:HIT-like protein n=1 Tax=Candidatus Fokinia crypta TaxID=1920990 RepID=A0ABZ0UPX5_9RICK|nr:HIT domain-containing protein [Candidatus Fokinia cryptica]WPX97592.1 HIT-like protein [Candidatus Fokinia cryptica]